MENKRAWVVVDLDKLRRNVRSLKKEVRSKEREFDEAGDKPLRYGYDEVKILGVVKADAYGHGAKEISEVLKQEGVQMLGVATVDEAMELREVGLPIVFLFPVSIDNIPTIVKEGFIPTITHYRFAEELNCEARRQNKRMRVHVEIDTGLMTAGVSWEDGVEFVGKLLEFKNLELDGIFTHFAESEDRNSGFTEVQIERFKEAVDELSNRGVRIPLVHAASTAGILNFPNSYFNMVRPGIMLYGLYPVPECERRIKVEPILSLHTRVCHINTVPKGTGISYRRTYITDREQNIATLCVGYGDGYPRSLSNRGVVIIKGRFAKVVGSVCMDLTMIDVTDIPEVEVGDKVTLIGKEGGNEITADMVAELAGTINYEITTRISPRVTKLYIKDKKPYKIKSLHGCEEVW